MSRKRFDKKGMMDDLFDFLFTVFVGFFLLVFLTVLLNSSIDNSNKVSFVAVNTVEVERMLGVFISSQVEYEGIEISLSDLLTSSIDVKEKKELFEQKASEFFKPSQLIGTIKYYENDQEAASQQLYPVGLSAEICSLPRDFVTTIKISPNRKIEICVRQLFMENELISTR